MTQHDTTVMRHDTISAHSVHVLHPYSAQTPRHRKRLNRGPFESASGHLMQRLPPQTLWLAVQVVVLAMPHPLPLLLPQLLPPNPVLHLLLAERSQAGRSSVRTPHCLYSHVPFVPQSSVPGVLST